MTKLPEPSFIDRDPAAVTAELIEIYEGMTGKTLYPAQPERLFIDLIAYRESLLRVQIQQAAVKNLVRFSSGVMLDYLGELVGCPRLPEQPARTKLRFTLDAVQTFDVQIPAGTEVQTKDGKFSFATDSALSIAAGQLTGDVAATAQAAGIASNGYLAGEVNSLVDPVPYVGGVASLSVTLGGADVESDDHYRERIMLKPDSYSTAGPEDAYVFWAKSAHQDIIDVAITSPSANVVNVYPLMSNGLPSDEILDQVAAIFADRKRRPLTDQVNALAPTQADFSIEATVILYDWSTDDADTAKANIEELLATYAAELRGKLGQDQVPSQINSKIMAYRGVYSCALAAPAAAQVLEDNEWLNCTAIIVTIAGYVRG